MPVSRASNFGNPHIGLFAKASDNMVSADVSASEKFIESLAGLKVPIIKSTFGGSGLAGIFLAINSNGAVLPGFCTQEEKALFKNQGLSVETLPGRFSAAGNNIAANDKSAVINPGIRGKERKKISDCLGVEAVPMKIAGYATAGSCIVATNRGFAAHNRATEQELKELESIFGVKGSNCTLNVGVPFVSLGAIANSKAAVFGELSTGFEVGRAAEALSAL